ncbi:MAG TPA: SOS response-associated peptidase family protein [Bryobacteraceae bacterium]|jgi:putative SOS response-associated peptidase YedK
MPIIILPEPIAAYFVADKRNAEVVAEKPAYRKAFVSHPCLVPADGFYEWKQIGLKEKQPYFFTTKFKEPFAFAGLWEWWRAKDAPLDAPGLETFTILTTEPNELVGQSIIECRSCSLGTSGRIGSGRPDQRKTLLRSFPAERTECWPVGKAVGNVRNGSPELIERIVA